MTARAPPPPATRPGREAVRKNRRYWQRISAPYERKHERALRVHGGRAWGLWRLPEDELHLLGPTRGRRVLELGCGAARWSIGLQQEGAHPVGMDVSIAHLRHAQAELAAADARFPLVVADAERLPFRDTAFDVVFCDWGAMTFCDPYHSVPEVARVLRPGGIFAFATASPIQFMSLGPRTDRVGRSLVRPYFGMHRVDLPKEVDFTLPYGEWIRLFRENQLEVERLIEPRGGSERSSSYVTPAEREWSARFPMEIIWGLRKAPTPGNGKSHPRPRSGRRDDGGARRRGSAPRRRSARRAQR